MSASPSARADDPEPESIHPPESAPIEVEVCFTLEVTDTNPPTAGWIEQQLARALQVTGVRSGSLSVTLIDDATMQRLHAEHCDDPTTTDVLTFDLRDEAAIATPGESISHIDGDLVICRDEARRQAAARGHDTREELLLYAVHGLMHLLGEDDHDEADYQKMHEREDDLLTRLGLGPLFHGRGDTR